MSQAILFDRDEAEVLDDLVRDRPRRLGRSKLLWVDVDERTAEHAASVAEAFGLDERTRNHLKASDGPAVFEDYGRYIHVTTYAPDEETRELIPIECVVGDHWVVTAHDQRIPVLEEFKKRVSGSGDTGVLDGPSFLAALLEWVLERVFGRLRAHGASSSKSSTSRPCGVTAGRGHRAARDHATSMLELCDALWQATVLRS